MHRRIPDRAPAPTAPRAGGTQRPARAGHVAGRPGAGRVRSLLLLTVAAPWLGLAALWAATAPPLLDQGEYDQVSIGTAVGAAALLTATVLALRVHRSLAGRLEILRSAAREFTERALPAAAERMMAGLPVDVDEVVPDPRLGGDELGRAAREVTAAQRAAVALAVRQSDSRENVRKVFLSLARRTQALIHRQIAMLDQMERDHEDPDLLEELFAVDHLSTRLRRHAENLVILGGALPPRQWRHGVQLMDVVRSAVSETEEYTRIEVENLPRSTVSGRAVADIVHLLSELLENGCMFSPPHTSVTINGEEVSHGLVLEIEDRGLGMPEEQAHRINALLATPGSFDNAPLGEDGRLGMYVVGRLAHRHNVNVELRRSPYGGTRAIVLLPLGLVETKASAAAASKASTGGDPLPWAAAPAIAPGRVDEPEDERDEEPDDEPDEERDGSDAAEAEPSRPAEVRERRRHAEPKAPEPPKAPEAPRLPRVPEAPENAAETPQLPEAPRTPKTAAESVVRFDSLSALADRMAAMNSAAMPDRPEPQPGPAPLDEAERPSATAAHEPAPEPEAAPHIPGEGDATEASEDEPAARPRILPKRVKHASLADQLRESAAAEEALAAQRSARRAEPAPTPTAEEARARMAAIQRATRLARDSEPRDTRVPTPRTGGADSPATISEKHQ